MKIERFRGPGTGTAMTHARSRLGDDVVLVQTRFLDDVGSDTVEILAATPDTIEDLKRRLREGRALPSTPWSLKARRPTVVAVVGPPGAGKTTALMKMALHDSAFADKRVGLLTLDTEKIAAHEQLAAYAELAGLPFEIAYHPDELKEIWYRLRGCSVVLVDTPGRPPTSEEGDTSNWVTTLRAIRPDEVHLVVPATMRRECIQSVGEQWGPCWPTHLIPSRLDEGGAAWEDVVGLVHDLSLPPRWVSAGPDVPGRLEPAAARILSDLGLEAPRARAEAAPFQLEDAVMETVS